MSKLPNCPECNSEYAYEDRGLLICRNADMSGAQRQKKLAKKKCSKTQMATY